MIIRKINYQKIAENDLPSISIVIAAYNEIDFITKKIHQLAPILPDVQLMVEGGIGRPPMERTERNNQLWQLAKINGSLLGLDIKESLAGGGSDGNTTSLYTSTLDGLGTTGDGAHAKHEYIFLEKLPERTALLSTLILSRPLEYNSTMS